MASGAAAIQSRAREQPIGDEEATSDLKLGEFQDVPTLSLSEARLLINAVHERREGRRKGEETE
jgi:DNA-directed RNA polymerase II subunit RPB4